MEIFADNLIFIKTFINVNQLTGLYVHHVYRLNKTRYSIVFIDNTHWTESLKCQFYSISTISHNSYKPANKLSIY